jgi:hypothetical protein
LVFHPLFSRQVNQARGITVALEAHLRHCRDVLVHPAYRVLVSMGALRLGLNFTTNDGYVSRPAFRRDMRVRDAIRAPIFNDTPQIGRDALRCRRDDSGSVRGEGKVGAQAVTWDMRCATSASKGGFELCVCTYRL